MLKDFAQRWLGLYRLGEQVEFLKGQLSEVSSKCRSQLQHNISILKPADDFALLEPASEQTGQQISTHSDEFDPPPDLMALAAEDTRPLPTTEDCDGYHGERHFDYWLSGLRDYVMIRHLNNKYDIDLLSLVYAFSVFSHIAHLETAWRLELQRVLQPGGVAYLSIHSECTWKRMREAYRSTTR